jgi:phosphopantetheine adenylyltransferase
MELEAFLSRLEKVRGKNGSFTACCPAHRDNSPSLAIRQDGERILLHCFAGCDVNSVVSAVGLTLGDLFQEERKWHRQKPAKRRFYATDLLRIINKEALIVVICAIDMAKGKTMSEADLERLKVAAGRIEEAVRCNGG